MPLSWVSPRTAALQSSTMNFICPRCQHAVFQSSLVPIWKTAEHIEGKSCNLLGRFQVFFRNYDFGWNLGPHFQPETKQKLSKQWKHLGSLKEVKTVMSAGNIMASHFLGCRRNSVGGLPRQGSHYHQSLLC